MDEQRPRRRRELTSEEKKNLNRQQLKERELQRKQARREARIREQARAQARRKGEDSHIVIEIPAAPPKKKKPPKPRKKTLPDIIEKETDRKVRDMEPIDHRDGYYVNEVGVRRKTAEKQRVKRKKAQPKPLSPKQRRARRIAAYIALIAVVIIVGVILSLTVLFKTESIEVKGNKYYDESKIINLSGVREGDNIFMASMFADTNKIVEELPYIREADVSFNIPNGLVITVKNEAPYYSLQSEGKYYLVSKDNRLLEQIEKKPKKLMFIDAPKLKSSEIGDYVKFEKQRYTTALDEIIASIKKNKISDITSISVKDIDNITITYDNRILIKLGVPDSIDYKIRTAFAIINNKLDPSKTKTIMGILDVSNCNTGTKKSYFREVEIKEKKTDSASKSKKSKKTAKKKKATEATTAPTTTSETTYATESATEYYTDYSSEEYTEYPTESTYYYEETTDPYSYDYSTDATDATYATEGDSNNYYETDGANNGYYGGQ